MIKKHIVYGRITDEEKASLDTIVATLPGSQSAHVRQAVREYNARILPTLAHPPSVVPATADPAEKNVVFDVPLREVGQ